MLVHKRIVIFLALAIVLSSLIFILPIKAESYFAEMPPYDDKWTFTAGNAVASADANLTEGKTTVFVDICSLNESSSGVADVKM